MTNTLTVGSEAYFPPYRKYTGDKELLRDDLQIGQVVKLIHEHDAQYGESYTQNKAVVLALGEKKFSFLHVAGIMDGWLDEAHYTDKGLEQYHKDSDEKDGGIKHWNPVNHVQDTEVTTSTTPLSQETATRIQALFANIENVQQEHGVTPTEASVEEEVLLSFVNRAIHGNTTHSFRRSKVE